MARNISTYGNFNGFCFSCSFAQRNDLPNAYEGQFWKEI